MEYTRIQIVLAGGSWRRGTRVADAVEGRARGVVVEPEGWHVVATVVSPRRATALGAVAKSARASEPLQHETVIAASQRVRAVREVVGRVSRVWCCSASRNVTHLLVQAQGRFRGQRIERIVPVEYVGAIAQDGIMLKLGLDDFRALPLYREDEVILVDVQAALEEVLADPRARRQVKVRVDDGLVTLAGEVDTIDQARLAQRAAAGVPGVRGLTVDLVAQETVAELVEARIAALGTSVMNGHGPIQVFSEHGIVYLEGSVPSATARQEVERAALSAAGTKVVVNNLRISGEPPERGQGTGPLVRNR